MTALLITNAAQGGARAVIHPDALVQHEARGWAALGPISDPSRDPLLTDAEQADADAALAARVAALLDPQASPGAAAAVSTAPKKPARAAAQPQE